MGGIRVVRGDTVGGEGSILGESSLRFPIMGGIWNSSHSGGVGLSSDNVLDFGCVGNRGLVWPSVMETMGGNSGGGSTGSGIGSSGRNDNEAIGGDVLGVISLEGGTSHGRGMRSRDEGPMCFFTGGQDGGNGISSGVGGLFHGAGIIGVASLIGGDRVSDWGKGTLTGLGVSSIGAGGLYCSIDEYCRRCDPQGTRGSGGEATQGGSTGGGLG